jgi:hypothetical protein
MYNQVEKIGILLSHNCFNFTNEIELQDGIEGLLSLSEVDYKREVRLSKKDIPDFVLNFPEGKLAIEVKIGGTKNALLRQISRYLLHEINGIFVVGTPYWINQLPPSLCEKPVWCYRLMGSLL